MYMQRKFNEILSKAARWDGCIEMARDSPGVHATVARAGHVHCGIHWTDVKDRQWLRHIHRFGQVQSHRNIARNH